jgi:RNA polymerase sigma-70 factor, ECF subfamily
MCSTEVDERELVAALRAGDDATFSQVIEAYHPSLVRVAMLFVQERAVAEEVAQETWLSVLRGLHLFEGRSTFRTWLFSILTNQARRRGQRERRSIAFSALNAVGEPEAAVPSERFRPPGELWAGWWALPPTDWQVSPEDASLSAELHAEIGQAIATLPAAQRAVITMRDIEGWNAQEVCTLLDISPGNQRVLLHRARSRVRAHLESSRIERKT